MIVLALLASLLFSFSLTSHNALPKLFVCVLVIERSAKGFWPGRVKVHTNIPDEAVRRNVGYFLVLTTTNDYTRTCANRKFVLQTEY